ncbi:hypothetical protein CK203_117813 [Vitis vinifera]|uniref:Reverse transcriptase domain-containing protein n=1 Tax=Vitis vinifera TaxID=29760 RepID=A0A438CZX1_VITVI|nr:hypothetical protein CK203_117813 [Vitis vinifera]
MKHHSTWEIYIYGSLKVKQRTIVITKQTNKGCPKDVEESSTHTSYHVTVQVDSNPKFSDDEPGEVPQVFEDGGQATVDELKELNLGTNENPRPIYEVKYPAWIANIVSVKKKNGQIRVCVDFKYLNNACPKDDFQLPIIELMVDATTGHEALSFMDGSLRSRKREDHLRDLRMVFDRLRRYQLKMNSLKCAFGVTSGKFLGFIVRHRGIEVNQSKITAIRDMTDPRKSSRT